MVPATAYPEKHPFFIKRFELHKRRSAVFVNEPAPIAAAGFAMSFSTIRRGKKACAQKASAHHAFSTANKFSHPHKILAGRETELHLNVMKKLESVTAEGVEAITGCFNEITYVGLMNPRCCSRAAALQSVPC
jgi:hypothetical protein